MARKDKPIKIKRYKNSMGGIGYQNKLKVRRTLALVCSAVLLVAVGYFVGKPVLNFITSVPDSQPQSSSQAQTESEASASSLPSSSLISSQTDDMGPVTTKNRVFYYPQPNQLTSAQGIDTVIATMKNKGATHCVITLKNQEGYLLYPSSNEIGAQLAGSYQLDLPLITAKLAENGITPVAQVYTFMDKMVSTIDRTTAVLYQGTEARWLDSSAALGGKAWANPASAAVQQYLISLTDEILKSGIKEIIYAGYHTPTGNSLDKRDFGASQDQVLAHMKTLVSTLEAKVTAKGGFVAWQVELEALSGGSYAQYLVHPTQLLGTNLIVTAKQAQTDAQQAVSILKDVISTSEVQSATLWISDSTSLETGKELGSYFVK